MAELIHIPEPCHEDWDEMRPEDNGRHCLQCCKTVVDFTGWEMQDIVAYLKNTKGKTCGRFTAGQVQATEPPQPEELVRYVIRASIPFYRKLAAMIVLFFGLAATSCDAQKTTGGAEVVAPHFNIDSITVQQPPVAIMGAVPVPVVYVMDTAKHRPLMGKPALSQHEIVKGRVSTVKPKPKPHKKPVGQPKPPAYLQGDVQVTQDAPPPKEQGHP